MHALLLVASLFLASDGGISTSDGVLSRHFVPNTRIILFGEVLEQVPSDDGKSLGTLIERTEDAVLINGKVWVSKDQKPKEPVRTAQYAEYERKAAILEEAARQFRARHSKMAEDRYSADGNVYGETPQFFHVERYDESVEVAVKGCATCMTYIYVTYEGTTVGFPLYPVPAPSPEEQEERRLDNAFQSAVNNTRPGTIVFVTHGHYTPYALEKADSFIAAMRKVPSLAVPVAEDVYGDTAYRSVTVDGFFFGPQMVAVIMRGKGGRKQ